MRYCKYGRYGKYYIRKLILNKAFALQFVIFPDINNLIHFFSIMLSTIYRFTVFPATKVYTLFLQTE